MRWWCGAMRFSLDRFEVRITGRALVMMAFFLLTVEIRWLVAALAAAAVHELGHGIALWLCGIKIRRLELDAFGAIIETDSMKPEEELLCALSGPVGGLLLCLFWKIIPRTAALALAQTLFNLLPVYPLDGGRVWRALRNICCKDGHFGVQ